MKMGFQNFCLIFKTVILDTLIQKRKEWTSFTGQFKAVLIETDEQLLHVSRYIHLNPATSYIVKDFVSLLNYPWSSLPEYIGKVKSFCEANKILEFLRHRRIMSIF